jgi:hypothetical protein
MTLNELYAFAEQQNHDVIPYDLGPRAAMSIQMGGRCYIGIDPLKLSSVADEKTKLGHELGHCETGSFYNQYSPFDVKQKHENRAYKWEIRKLIPEQELNSAVAAGHTAPWDLAEYFGVNEDFMRMAMCYYRHGTLKYRNYFN